MSDVLGRAPVPPSPDCRPGCAPGSLARAVDHTSIREQFGRPLSTNQGVLLRAADAHMDTEAIRVTAYEAAWRYDAGLPRRDPRADRRPGGRPRRAKRVVHTGQHLHGGIGADVDHPVHRHFLWGRQLDAYLGRGAEVLLGGAGHPMLDGGGEPCDGHGTGTVRRIDGAAAR